MEVSPRGRAFGAQRPRKPDRMTGIPTARRRSTASHDDAERTHNAHPIAGLLALTGKITKNTQRSRSSSTLYHQILLYFSTIPGGIFILVIVTHIPHSGRTERASSQPLRHEKELADPERMLEHRVKRGFSQC